MEADERGLNNETQPVRPTRSHYYLSRSEILKGVANRWLFSSFYIYLYLSMALLSLTTVILSLLSECPTLPFYILEIIINSAMIIETVVRFIAFGPQFWKSYYNYLDIGITVICIVTVLVVFFSGCSAKSEEVFDDILLIGRNVIQFGRLALVMRRSGKNIFSKVGMIDLDAVGQDEEDDLFTLDLDQQDEEADLMDRRRTGGDLTAQQNSIGAKAHHLAIDSDED